MVKSARLDEVRVNKEPREQREMFSMLVFLFPVMFAELRNPILTKRRRKKYRTNF